MPYGRSYSGKRRTRRLYSSFRRRAPNRGKKIRRYPRMGSRIPRSLVPFGTKWQNPVPLKRSFRLRYIDNDFTAAPTHLVPSVLQAFAGNSLFDPDKTGVGVQPYWYDQLATMYSKYHVFASKITIYPTSVTSTGGSGMVKCFVLPTYTNYTGLANSDPSDLKNMKNCREMHFAVDPTTTSTSNRRKITNYETTRNEAPDNYKDRDYSALMTAGPTITWYWQVIWDSTHDDTNDYTISYDVKIVYYAVLTHDQMNVNES